MEINCEFYGVIYNFMYLYTCHINEANIMEKNQLIRKFQGFHDKGKSNKDVQSIYFRQTKMKYFPRSLGTHFPNLTILIVLGGKLKEISKNDLKGLEGLITFHIGNCELTSLPDDLLTDIPNLRTVSFRDNKIDCLSSKLLKPFVGRENVKVDLKGNKSIDAWFWPREEDSLNSLEDLMKLIDEKCTKPFLPTFVPDFVEFNPKLKDQWVTGKLNEMQNLRKVSFNESKIELDLKENIKPLLERKTQHQQGQSISRVNDLTKLQPCHQYKKSIELVQTDPTETKIKDLWHPEKFYNLTIIADGKKFKVHKTVLRMQSEVFAQTFDESEANEIKLPGFSAKSVEALIKFIYTNEVSEDGNAKENFDIANKFKVTEMKSFYEKIICEQIDEANAWETFLFAHRLSSQQLKEKAFRQIAEKFPEDLPKELMEDPESLKKLLDYRRGYEEILAKIKSEP